ncbi:hypothetical protein [Mycolicibacterium holsaticum]|uniref:Uncharacterized protein n=1 Tax=Mycolicibacterium holsaticum TaxID=152142 RepID=A0A1E3S0D7_9MYCO|nr:hypothetical protein [Mycolicibacterium holsaticum]ODQ95541.1 hypothetical protein BHQ17_04455 [Mycolicibacterium holsaticum]
MAKRDNDPSEFERVAREGWMVTLRYRMLLTTKTATWSSKARWVLGGASVAYAVTEVAGKFGWL